MTAVAVLSIAVVSFGPARALAGLPPTRAAPDASESISQSTRSVGMRFVHDARAGRLTLWASEQPLFVYVYRDAQVTRPYFQALRTRRGRQVTRPHPPAPKDRQDHASMHPGLWHSFGDLAGRDYWRLKTPTRHARFIQQPSVAPTKATFVVENVYCDVRDETPLVVERCAYTVRLLGEDYWLDIRAEFAPVDESEELYFGDQEEMGLGVRVATSMSAARGGVIRDAQGRIGEAQVWGETALWCDYSGPVGGQNDWAGVSLVSMPGSFRQPRWHARDYGLLVANPFADRAFGRPELGRTPFSVRRPLQVHWAVYVHDGRLESSRIDTLRRFAERTTVGSIDRVVAANTLSDPMAVGSPRVDVPLRKLWKQIGVSPAARCDDAEFLRRASRNPLTLSPRRSRPTPVARSAIVTSLQRQNRYEHSMRTTMASYRATNSPSDSP